jgi:hypothetical protein
MHVSYAPRPAGLRVTFRLAATAADVPVGEDAATWIVLSELPGATIVLSSAQCPTGACVLGWSLEPVATWSATGGLPSSTLLAQISTAAGVLICDEIDPASALPAGGPAASATRSVAGDAITLALTIGGGLAFSDLTAGAARVCVEVLRSTSSIPVPVP